MGMFNEIYINCTCGQKAVAQILQINNGFGNYDMNDYKTYSHLSQDDQVLLADRVREALTDYSFYCYVCDKRLGLQAGVS